MRWRFAGSGPTPFRSSRCRRVSLVRLGDTTHSAPLVSILLPSIARSTTSLIEGSKYLDKDADSSC